MFEMLSIHEICYSYYAGGWKNNPKKSGSIDAYPDKTFEPKLAGMGELSLLGGVIACYQRSGKLCV